MNRQRPRIGDRVKVLSIYHDNHNFGYPEMVGEVVTVNALDADGDVRFTYQDSEDKGCANAWEIAPETAAHKADLLLIHDKLKELAMEEGQAGLFNTELRRIEALLSRPFKPRRELPTVRGTVIKGTATVRGVKKSGYFIRPQLPYEATRWFMLKGGWGWLNPEVIDDDWEIVELP